MGITHNPKLILNGLSLGTDPKDINITSNLSKEQLEANGIGYSNWNVGSTSAIGFSRNGSVAENEIVRITDDPWGNENVAWECRGQGENNADGGWNGSYFNIDHTKKYRFSIWYRRTVQGTGTSGNFYFGLNAADATTNIGPKTLAGSNNTNPYFEITSANQPQWILIVAYVHPSDYTGGADPTGGGYLADGSKTGNGVTDFKWDPLNTRARQRSYLYYNINAQTIQQMMYPRIDIIDGTEPSINDLATGKAYGLKNGVNQTNYIALKGGAKLTSDGMFFDGVNDHAVLKPESNYDATGDFSINMWVRPETTIQNSFIAFASKWNGGTDGWQLFWHSGNYVYLYVNDGIAVFSNNGSGPSSLVAGTWYNIVAVFRANTTNSKIFINGVDYSANQSSRIGGTTNGLAPTLAAQPGNTNYNNHCTIGKFDFYNRALLDSEVTTMYNNNKSRFR